MADAASGLLSALSLRQRALAGFPGPPDPTGEAERLRWFYTPTDHGGLTLAEMTPTQYRRTMALVASGLSHAGFVTVSAVIGLENTLDHTERFAGPNFERERGRDPGMYYVRVFGQPGDRVWGWRFGGHHVSLNNLVVDGAVVSSTPCFLGADPAAAPLLGGAVLRPLASVEDLARELFRSLSPAQQEIALLTPVAPVDIVGGNRTRLGDRPARGIPLPRLMREHSDPELDRLLAAAHDAAERASGAAEHDHAAHELTPAPKGIPADALDDGQRGLLRAVLGCYTGRAPTELAEVWSSRWDGPGLDGVHFAWAGSGEPGQPHYYRLQGPRLLVEYDNVQRQVNHAHSVWRDPEGDFGADVLAEHLTEAH
jgi:hypothetical protein